MRYQRLLEQVAQENNTTPEKVKNGMRKALQIAGYDIEPAIFIALEASKVKRLYIVISITYSLYSPTKLVS